MICVRHSLSHLIAIDYQALSIYLLIHIGEINMFTPIKRAVVTAATLSLLATSSIAVADGNKTYSVTITNLTHAISFTPIMVSSHKKGVSIFELGAAASSDLTAIAEGGNTAPMEATLGANKKVIDVTNSGGLLKPGQSVTVKVSAKHGAKHISVASMMLPTNDGFIALNSVKAPRHGTRTYYSPGYDAGTETNDELCVNIPGPTCGGTPFSPEDDGEGYIHVHRGMHDVGDLPAHTYDWRNPVAKISITRMK